MEDKKLTEKESVELIVAMIENTRRRIVRGAGDMLLFWGYLCVAVVLLRYLLEYFGPRPLPSSTAKAIWWLIPLIGIPYTLIKKRRNARTRNVLTYTDKLSTSLWDYVLWLSFAAMAIGALFFIAGLNVWYVMLLFAFFVVGMAVSVQGIIINEKSMIWGGGFSVLSGGFLTVGMISGASWLIMFTSPSLIIAFIFMMIIPGHILNHKAKTA